MCSAIDSFLARLPDSVLSHVKSTTDLPSSFEDQLHDLVHERIRLWASTRCTHVGVPDDEDESQAPEAFWSQLGVCRKKGAWFCDICQFRFADDASAYHLDRHVVSDAHDENAALQRHLYCLAGGWEARELWRKENAERVREQSSKRFKPDHAKQTADDRAAKRKACTAERTRRVQSFRDAPTGEGKPSSSREPERRSWGRHPPVTRELWGAVGFPGSRFAVDYADLRREEGGPDSLDVIGSPARTTLWEARREGRAVNHAWDLFELDVMLWLLSIQRG